jgi:hypothetical protein
VATKENGKGFGSGKIGGEMFLLQAQTGDN